HDADRLARRRDEAVGVTLADGGDVPSEGLPAEDRLRAARGRLRDHDEVHVVRPGVPVPVVVDANRVCTPDRQRLLRLPAGPDHRDALRVVELPAGIEEGAGLMRGNAHGLAVDYAERVRLALPHVVDAAGQGLPAGDGWATVRARVRDEDQVDVVGARLRVAAVEHPDRVAARDRERLLALPAHNAEGLPDRIVELPAGVQPTAGLL